MTSQDIRTQMPNFNTYQEWRRPNAVDSIIIHHSGSGTVNGGGLPNLLLRDMANRHVHDEGRAHISYHYAIARDGKSFYMLDEEISGYHVALPEPSRSRQAAAWQRWQRTWENGQYFNRRSIAIVLLGWFDLRRRQDGQTLPNNHTTTPTEAQWEALISLVREILQRRQLPIEQVKGHREVFAQAGFGTITCPGTQVDMNRLRAALRTPPVNPSDNDRPTFEETGKVVVPGPPPPLNFPQSRPTWYYASSAKIPSELPPGIEVEFPLAVGNGGRSSWLSEGTNRVIINVKWVDGQDKKKTVGQNRWLRLPRNMSTGAQAQLRTTIKTPDTDGLSRLRIALFHNGRRKWLRQLDRRTEPDYFPVQVATPRDIDVEPPDKSEPPVTEPPDVLYGVRYEATLPPRMTVGVRREVSVRLYNTGGRLWHADGEAPITVVHQWLNSQGRIVQPTLRTLLPYDVPPNGNVVVQIPLLAPAEPGNYRLRIDMAEEGRLFFSQQGNAPYSHRLTVEAARSAAMWGAHWLNVQLPTQFSANEQGRVEVRLRNVGQRVWERGKVRVAYRWDNGVPNRVALSTDVPPGGEIALGLPIIPTGAGQHQLILDLWHEETGWLNVEAPAQSVTVMASRAIVMDPLAVGGGFVTSPAASAPTFAMLAIEDAPDEEPDEVFAEEDDPELFIDVEEEVETSPINQPGEKPKEVSSEAVTAPSSVPTPIVKRPPVRLKATASEHPERAILALDRHKITAWSSGKAQAPGIWFQLDLGSQQAVRGLRLTSRPEQFPRGYLLEGSQDGQTWNKIHAAPQNWSDIELTLPQTHSVRYLRITLTTFNPWQFPWSIRDLSVDVEE